MKLKQIVMISTSSPISQLVMETWFMIMIQRLSSSTAVEVAKFTVVKNLLQSKKCITFEEIFNPYYYNFFEIQGTVHKKSLLPDPTVSDVCYKVLKQL